MPRTVFRREALWRDNTTVSASHELVETIADTDSVLIDMLPVTGANLQCGAVRVPVSAITPVLTGIPFTNGFSPWAWVASKSQFCNPDEVADSQPACQSAAAYDTTGSGDGRFAVGPIFLNSLGRCTVPAGGTRASHMRAARAGVPSSLPALSSNERHWRRCAIAKIDVMGPDPLAGAASKPRAGG